MKLEKALASIYGHHLIASLSLDLQPLLLLSGARVIVLKPAARGISSDSESTRS